DERISQPPSSDLIETPRLLFRKRLESAFRQEIVADDEAAVRQQIPGCGGEVRLGIGAVEKGLNRKGDMGGLERRWEIQEIALEALHPISQPGPPDPFCGTNCLTLAKRHASAFDRGARAEENQTRANPTPHIEHVKRRRSTRRQEVLNLAKDELVRVAKRVVARRHAVSPDSTMNRTCAASLSESLERG